MERIFLGTSAGEAIPCIFCRCDYCQRARKTGGKNIRSRSSFRIDGKHQIDFSPDSFYQMMKYGLDVFELEHLLITHTHKDHFDLAEILVKEYAVTTKEQPLNIYLSPEAAGWAEKLLERYSVNYHEAHKKAFQEKIRFVVLQPFEPFQAGDLTVTPLKGNHRAFGVGEYANNYLITLKDGKNLCYASDTGWYGEETWAFLKGKKTDILVMECTYGGRDDRGLHVNQHLDIPNFVLMLNKMSDIGFIDMNTEIYATHINHKQPLLHDELQQTFNQTDYTVTVAYDGLSI